MDMKATNVDIDGLATRFSECAPRLDTDGKRISLALYGVLAEGEPARVSNLATKAGLGLKLVREKLQGWPGVFFDREWRIQGYWGLAIPRTSHRFEVGGKTLYMSPQISWGRTIVDSRDRLLRDFSGLIRTLNSTRTP